MAKGLSAQLLRPHRAAIGHGHRIETQMQFIRKVERYLLGPL